MKGILSTRTCASNDSISLREPTSVPSRLAVAAPLDFFMTIFGPFLLVWIVKTLILRLGGMGAYRRAIPFFLGLIIGHFFLAGLIWGWLYTRRGYETAVHSREPRGKKSALVESFGVGWSSRREESLEDLSRRVGAIDVMLEASGASPAAFEALPALGPNGVFVFTGIPGRKAPVPREAASVMPGIVLRNQAVLGVTNPSTDAYRAAVQDLALFARRWPTLLPQVVTSRRPFDEAPEVMRGPARGFKEALALA